MSAIIFKWVKRLATLTIVFLSLYFFYSIGKVSPNLFIALSFLTIFSITTNGNKLRLITESFNIKLNLKEWIGLAFISSFFNGVVYKSGSLITSNYLKKKYKFSYASFLGALGADHFMLIMINAFVGLGISIYTMISHTEIFPITF